MIDIGDQAGNGLGEPSFTALREHIFAGNRSINRAEKLHGARRLRARPVHRRQRPCARVRIRMGVSSMIVHDTIACMVPQVASRSSPLTGYGDFSPVRDNLIERNLFKATPAWFAPAEAPRRARNLRRRRQHSVHQQRFRARPRGRCDLGRPTTDFDDNARGKEWSGTHWDTGELIR